MDTNERLRQLLDERGLTTYKMAELSGLSHTTLANVFKKTLFLQLSRLKKYVPVLVSHFLSFLQKMRLWG